MSREGASGGLATLRLLALLGPVLAAPGALGAQLPVTDIVVLDLEATSEGFRVASLVEVTARDDYDNQPHFLADGDLLYTAGDPAGSTDIRRYDFDTGRSAPWIATPEGEYSAQRVPGEDLVSVVRDYGDQVQRLWGFPLGAGSPRELLPELEGAVGYSAWIDRSRVLLFVLGDPPTLQIATRAGEQRVLTESPGRALARIPGAATVGALAVSGAAMSYVDRRSDDSAAGWWLVALDPESGRSERLVRLPAGVEDYAWAADGSVWAGSGRALLRWTGEGDWTTATEVPRTGRLAGEIAISRLAFDDDGKRLAVVYEPVRE